MCYDSFIVAALWFLATYIALVFTAGHPVPSKHLGFQLYLFAVLAAFYICFWVKRGQTAGMVAWKIKVRQADGKPLTWTSASVRFFCAFCSLLLGGFGLYWGIFDKRARTLYDVLSKTELVRTSS